MWNAHHAPTPAATVTPAEIRREENAVPDLVTLLDGHGDGRVTLPDHTMTIGPRVDIRGEIAAKIVVIMGTVTGNITASEKVAIRATGAVIGDIVSPSLAIEDGGRLHGKVEMSDTRKKSLPPNS